MDETLPNNVRDEFASDLERLSRGQLSADDIRARYWAPSMPDAVQRVMAYVEHYLDDADIRDRDSEYWDMQETEMRKLIQLLKSRAPLGEVLKIHFLGPSGS